MGLQAALLLLLGLAAVGVSATPAGFFEEEADLALAPPGQRSLQAIFIGPRPPVCMPLSGVPALTDPTCPKLATRDGDICWLACPPAYRLASDQRRCIPPCPDASWVEVGSSDDGVTCSRCAAKACQYLLTPTPGCYERCGGLLTSVQSLPTSINGVCCGPCPVGTVAVRGTTSCRSLIGGTVARRSCRAPGPCASTIDTTRVAAVPRPSAPATCPDGTLTVPPSTSGGALQCWACPTGSYPARDLKGVIRCFTNACPAGYEQCFSASATQCWDVSDAVLAAVLQVVRERKACDAFVRRWANCVPGCPIPIVPPVVNPPARTP